MANESNFSLKQVGLIKESTVGEINTTPKLYNLGVMGSSLAPTQKTETNTEMGQDGQATAMDTGSKDYAGSINTKLKTSLIPILMHCVAGKSTKVAVTTDTWAATTTYLAPVNKFVAGQIVNHSDGIHTLVVKSVSGTGTSGATEPAITGLNEYETIIDNPGANQIVWIVRNKLYEHTGTTDTDMGSVGIYTTDNSAQNGGVDFEQYFSGSFFNSFQISKSSGTIVYKYDVPVVSMGYTDNTQSDWQAIEPSSTVEIKDKSFSFDNMKVTIGGIQPVSAPEFSLTLSRNVSIDDQVEQGAKDYNVPVLTMDGNLKLKFTKEQWQSAYDNPDSEIVVTYANRTGDVAEFTFPVVKQLLGTIEKSTDKFNYITIPLSPSGSVKQKTMSYRVVSSSDW